MSNKDTKYNKDKKVSSIIAICLCAAVLIIGIISTIYQRKAILNDSIVENAIIINKHKGVGGKGITNYTITFQYLYEGKSYEGRNEVDKNDFDRLNIGDTIMVYVLKNSPDKGSVWIENKGYLALPENVLGI